MKERAERSQPSGWESERGMAKNGKKETIYTFVCEILQRELCGSSILAEGIRVFNRHGLECLKKRAPFITICSPGINSAHATFVRTIVEMKSHSVRITNDMQVQGVDYIERMAQAQPERRKFSVMIMNITENVLITLEIINGERIGMHYGPMDFYKAPEVLKYILADEDQQTKAFKFLNSLGNVERPLNTTKMSRAGAFKLKAVPKDLVCVSCHEGII
ncbi:hypothetical protein FN846DRAFT_892254 [Sphaerosporella brunnea]|uniref:Uncharacterized protein n=1 Tax=Sphaerosporella brunnea TaxID=1250544 RepID=A0A5J5EQQ4_9PEZI|nr:hypothetical protein FN846DRAFT_892254 [Sphaerosporella brunnea]